jgi:hypothetical protein
MSPDGEPAANAGSRTRDDPPKLRESVVGFVEILDESRVAGWAWCRGQPETRVDIEVRLGDRILQRARADRFRQDLLRAGVGDGKHGFNIVFDKPLERDQKDDLVALVVCGPDGPGVPLVTPTSKLASRTSKEALAGNAHTAAETSLRAVREAISELQKTMDERLSAIDGNIRSALTHFAADSKSAGKSIEAKCEELRSAQDSLGRYISALEVSQARLDAALSSVQDGRGKTTSAANAGRGLAVFVSVLALMSTASLVLGLISVFG